jgi:2-C-methyl-D-erythritol 4-phosphate cytidylyltransferase/2-C-methyl-D-erythritol 2,4-cyclodiphosphate synthase
MRAKPSEPDFVGVVVAAGSATRFGGPVPKQFLPLGGRPVLQRAVQSLTGHPAVGGVVVVLAPSEVAGPNADRVARWPGVVRVVPGGATRAHSVTRGASACGAVPYLLVHDAARPLAGRQVVEAVINATRTHGAAVPGLAIPDTVKRVDESGRVQETLDRSSLRLAQTPQGSRRDWLVEALEQAHEMGAEPTDEAAALERAGRPVALVAGDPDNFKITSEEDLERARRYLQPGESGLRVGTGFDVHRVSAERRLVLGGVEFEGEPGLAGHSDADVVLHAAMDALLGAAALGDIGSLFPPDDPEFEGADSTKLAADVARRLSDAGCEVINLDLMLLAERPRIREQVERMRETIGHCLGIEPSRVGLKATTLERLGALGRREGIACQAVALIHRGDPIR